MWGQKNLFPFPFLGQCFSQAEGNQRKHHEEPCMGASLLASIQHLTATLRTLS